MAKQLAAQRRSMGQKICFAYNRSEGCTYNSCKFAHICLMCKGVIQSSNTQIGIGSVLELRNRWPGRDLGQNECEGQCGT